MADLARSNRRVASHRAAWVALGALLLTGLAWSANAVPVIIGERGVPTIQQLEEEDGRVRCVLTNETRWAWSTWGFGPHSPLTDTRTWNGTRWEEHQGYVICGTGLREHEIQPGETRTFYAWIGSPSDRVGLTMNREGYLSAMPWLADLLRVTTKIRVQVWAE